MAELVLRLRVNPETGRKDVIVEYHSDEDALPMEHEEDHRDLLDRLIAGGVLTAEEAGDIVVERVTKEQDAPAQAAPEAEAAPEALANDES
jgi:hypothetical protein